MRKQIPLSASAATALGFLVVLAGCVAVPAGALLQVLPGADKSHAAFEDDQTTCKQFAQQSVSGQVDNTNLRTMGTAVLTTVLGTGMGAAIGGGHGAAIGAAAGALGGAGLGAITSSRNQGTVQQQSDTAYAQCMSTKGDTVPGGPTTTSQSAPQSQAATDP